MIGLKRGIVKLAKYSAKWSRLFEAEAKILRKIFGQTALEIQHVGSTSIPDLDAKPIVDIALAVNDLTLSENTENDLRRHGYFFRPNSTTESSKLYAKGPENRRTYYLHIVLTKSDKWENYLLFRDYLRKNSEAREQYLQLKQKLLQKFENNRDAYTEGKSNFIKKIIEEAKTENE